MRTNVAAHAGNRCDVGRPDGRVTGCSSLQASHTALCALMTWEWFALHETKSPLWEQK